VGLRLEGVRVRDLGLHLRGKTQSRVFKSGT
jgi:hypothetical protein